ncbi:MAG: alcohol dehydrogenase catalytic domain-containing protein [Chloroflexota bacterium]
MRGQMKALVKNEPRPGASLVSQPIPAIGPRDALVKIQAASVCGTDLHIYDWDPWAQSRLSLPRRFGHEMAGEVIEVGAQVTSVKPGDFVSADSHIACGVCLQCRTGRSHVCFLVAKHPYRAEIGLRMGATRALLTTDDVVSEIMRDTGGLGVEVVLEMSGNLTAVEQGFAVLTKGGRFTAFGVPREPMTFDLANYVVFKGARVLGISGRLMWQTWNQMASLLNLGALDPRPVITHRFPLDQYREAFALMRSSDRRVGKVVLLP